MMGHKLAKTKNRNKTHICPVKKISDNVWLNFLIKLASSSVSTIIIDISTDRKVVIFSHLAPAPVPESVIVMSSHTCGVAVFRV